jgi:hypothetical protein
MGSALNGAGSGANVKGPVGGVQMAFSFFVCAIKRFTELPVFWRRFDILEANYRVFGTHQW